MRMQDKILLIEDEPALVEGLSYSLRREGFELATCANGVDGLNTARSFGPQLVLLDWMLPGMDGPTVCRELRRGGFEGAVLMLTARDEEVDKVSGLECGADDYITKPFGTPELVARIRAHLRRLVRQIVPKTRLRLDAVRHQVYLDEREVVLSPREYELLATLMSQGEAVLTRERLMERVWGYDFEGDSNVLQVAVGRLRDKLGQGFIVTVRGVGYRLAAC